MSLEIDNIRQDVDNFLSPENSVGSLYPTLELLLRSRRVTEILRVCWKPSQKRALIPQINAARYCEGCLGCVSAGRTTGLTSADHGEGTHNISSLLSIIYLN